MNSWHSFSPNGHWLVFSSKSRSPYTQMFLAHLDENGNDSPAVLIENATAANRAVNIPEFVNVAPDGLVAIDAPVTDYYRVADVATDLMQTNQYQAAVAEWQKALELAPNEAIAHNNLGYSLVQAGRVKEAIPQYEKALELSPDYAEAHNNLGLALARAGRPDEAVAHYQKALELNPELASAHINFGVMLARANRIDEAIRHFEDAIASKPDPGHAREAHLNLGLALATAQRWAEASRHLEEADRVSGGRDPVVLDLLGGVYAEMGRFQEAIKVAGRALAIANQQGNQRLVEALKARIALYQSGTPLSRQ
jgi:tetratricopeptide (TPR) repeat protein